MGTFTVPIELRGPDGRAETLDAMVDTGATYLLVPAPVLRRLGVEPVRRDAFELADGRTEEYDVGVVTVRLEGREGPTYCIFGGETAAPLIGAIVLEGFLLAVDPVGHRLLPVAGQLR